MTTEHTITSGIIGCANDDHMMNFSKFVRKALDDEMKSQKDA